MMLDITITAQLHTGTSFGVADDGSEVFIPAHIMNCYVLRVGGKYTAYVQENHHHSRKAQWRVYGIDTTQNPEPAPASVPFSLGSSRPEENLEDEIMEQLSENEIYSVYDMVSQLYGEIVSTDPRYIAVANRLHGMHKAGKIAAASVKASASQERASFFLFAKSTKDFFLFAKSTKDFQ